MTYIGNLWINFKLINAILNHLQNIGINGKNPVENNGWYDVG